MSYTGCAAAMGVPKPGLGAGSRRRQLRASCGAGRCLFPRDAVACFTVRTLAAHRTGLPHELASVSPSVNEGGVLEGPRGLSQLGRDSPLLPDARCATSERLPGWDAEPFSVKDGETPLR